MIIGIPREIMQQESRVAALPEMVREYIAKQHPEELLGLKGKVRRDRLQEIEKHYKNIAA